ncbi:MBL fold metallo-hydrolase [Kribbella sp. NPDC056345]|uniref:MBL fold metallo-hydrolase n=1 Tax=Kribbella sp. NPDC056345 TaxID=3345789 RepID=UPI0035DAD541
MLRQLTERVWFFPHDPDGDAIKPSVGVIADERGSVVVDAGNGPEHAREVQAAIQQAGLPEPRWLVYTHHHWDHTWGACAWEGVTVVAHAAATELLRHEAQRPWSHRYLHDEVKREPKLGPSFRARALAVPDWDGFRIVTPDRTFDDTLTLPTGVVLRHLGGNHAPDSLMVLADGVAFVGDAFYPPPFHVRTESDTLDHGMVRRLLAEKHPWYVDAHSAPRGPSSGPGDPEADGAP